MSVDIAAPQPCDPLPPALNARKIAIAATIPPNAASNRNRQALALAQLADVELALCLQPDDEEEERHQPLVDPVAEIHARFRHFRAVIESFVVQNDS